MSAAAEQPIDLAAFITTNLRLVPARAVPEIVLHLAGPATGLRRLVDACGARAPYWAHQWAGGTALARHVLDNPGVVAGRRVLDLGCGSGLVAIAAARAGTLEVCAVDIDPIAVAATQLNAAANAVRVTAVCADGLSGAPAAIDVVLVGDLFYARELAASVTPFLTRCREAGIVVLVGDPIRAHLPLRRLRRLAEIAVPDFGGAITHSAIFAFDPDCEVSSPAIDPPHSLPGMKRISTRRASRGTEALSS